MSYTSEFAFAPWLRPGQTVSELRRTVQRLRSGAIRPADPQLSPLVLADVLEKTILKEQFKRWMVAELGGNNELYKSIKEREEEERDRRRDAEFHELKKSEEARDPDSPAAQLLRELNRERRHEQGRSRRRG